MVWADGSPVANASISFRDGAEVEPGIITGHRQANGRFKLEGYVGQQIIVQARSNRPYVALGDRFEPIERSETGPYHIAKATRDVRVVITKLR